MIMKELNDSSNTAWLAFDYKRSVSQNVLSDESADRKVNDCPVLLCTRPGYNCGNWLEQVLKAQVSHGKHFKDKTKVHTKGGGEVFCYTKIVSNRPCQKSVDSYLAEYIRWRVYANIDNLVGVYGSEAESGGRETGR